MYVCAVVYIVHIYTYTYITIVVYIFVIRFINSTCCYSTSRWISSGIYNMVCATYQWPLDVRSFLALVRSIHQPSVEQAELTATADLNTSSPRPK